MPFSQTMRSLNMSQARFSFIGLIVILLLLLAWLAWFLLAPINLYEISEPLQLPLDEAVVVDFPAESLERIRPGQSAVLYLESNGQQSEIRLPAEVMDVTLGPESLIQVWLQPDIEALFPRDPQENIINRVDIEVDRISPLTLLKQVYTSR